MKQIVKYDANNTVTHLAFITVDDNHVLANDELETLPEGFLTPAKIVDGKIVSSTQAESDAFYKNEHIENKPSADQLMQSSMLKEIADLKQQVAGLKAKVGGADNVSSN